MGKLRRRRKIQPKGSYRYGEGLEPRALLANWSPFAAWGSFGLQLNENGSLAAGQAEAVHSLSLQGTNPVSIMLAPVGNATVSFRLENAQDVVLATSTVATAAKPAVVTLPTASSGNYEVHVIPAAGSHGQYKLTVLQGGAFEQEWYGGPANNSLATAQDITSIAVAVTADIRTTNIPGTADGSVDFYRLNVASGELLSVSLSPGDLGDGELTAAGLDVLDSNGVLLARGVNLGSDQTVLNDLKIASTQEVFIAVRGVGPYRFTATRGALSSTIATREPGGQSISDLGKLIGNIDSRGVLYFAANTQPPSIYVVNRFTGQTAQIPGSFSGFIPMALSPDGQGGLLMDDGVGLARLTAEGKYITRIRGASPVANDDTQSLAYDHDRDVLYGIYNRGLFRIDPDTGEFIGGVLPSLVNVEITGMDYGQGLLYAVAEFSTELYAYDPVSENWRVVGNTGRTWPSAGLAYDPVHRVLYGKAGNSSDLFRIDPQTGQTVSIGSTNIALGGGMAVLPDIADPTANGWTVGGLPREYRLSLTAGQQVTIATQTPNGSQLDPQLELWNSSGIRVALDTNGAGDQRNARIQFTPTESGDYRLRVLPTGSTQGDYVLDILGAVASRPFNVVSWELDRGTGNDTVRVNFSHPVAAPSIAPDDFQLGTIRPSGVQIIDGDTVELTFPPLLAGTVPFQMTAGSVLDSRGIGIQGVDGTVTIDWSALEPLNGLAWISRSVEAWGTQRIRSEIPLAIDGASVTSLKILGSGTTDVRGKLWRIVDGNRQLALELDSASQLLVANRMNVAPGLYVLEVLDSNAAIRTVQIELLRNGVFEDEPSLGQNDAAGQAVSLAAELIELVTNRPRAVVRGNLVAGDIDYFGINLTSGQRLSIDVTVLPGTQMPALELRGAGDQLMALGAVTDEGRHTMIVDFVAPADGSYLIRLASLGAATTYQMLAQRNAGLDGYASRTGAPVQMLRDAVIGYLNPRTDAIVPGFEDLFQERILPYLMTDGGGAQWSIATDRIELTGGLKNLAQPVGMRPTNRVRLEAGGREVVGVPLPPTPIDAEMLRSAYVSPDYPFVRILDEAVSKSAINQPMVMGSRNVLRDGLLPALTLVADSSGDGVLTEIDRWAVYDDQELGGKDPLVLVFGDGRGIADPTIIALTDEVEVRYSETLRAGESAAYAYFLATANDRKSAIAIAEDISRADNEALWVGLSEAQRRSLRNFAVPSEDQYGVSANVGDNLRFELKRLDHNPDPLAARFAPRLELVNLDGLIVASANANADGAVIIQHQAAVAGDFTIRVISNSNQPGHYLLTVTGSTAAQFARITDGWPLPGQYLASIQEIVLTFDQSLLASSLNATGITIDGQPALSVRQLAHNKVAVSLPALADGAHGLTLSNQFGRSISGAAVQPRSDTFQLLTVAPRVVTSSLAGGQRIDPGPLEWQITLDRPLDVSEFDLQDVALTGNVWGRIPATDWAYDANLRRLTVQFAEVPEDSYRLELLSGQQATRGLSGLALDGNRVGTTLPSGDGVPGGNFAVDFEAELAVDRVTDWQSLGDTPWFGFEASRRRVLSTPQELDDFELGLLTGSVITLQARASVASELALIGPAGATLRTLNLVPGATDIVSVPFVATSDGTYRLRQRPTGNSVGWVSTRVLLGATPEMEPLLSQSNNTHLQAEPLDDRLQLDGPGVRHASVIGEVDGVDFYSLTVVNGDVVSISVQTVPGSNDPLQVTVWDSNGRQRLVAEPNQQGNTWTIPYVRVDSTGRWTVSIQGDGAYRLLAFNGSSWHDPSAAPNDQPQWLPLNGRAAGSLTSEGQLIWVNPEGVFHVVNPRSGQMVALSDLKPDSVVGNTALSVGPAGDELWVGTNQNNNLMRVDLGTGSSSGLAQMGLTGLTIDQVGGVIYGVYQRGFFEIDPVTFAVRSLAPSPLFIGDLAFGRGTIYALSAESPELLAYDIALASWRIVGNTQQSLGQAGLEYDPVRDVLFAKAAGDSRLFQVDPSTAAVTVVGDTGTTVGGPLAMLSQRTRWSNAPFESGDVGDFYRFQATMGQSLAFSLKHPAGPGARNAIMLDVLNAAGNVVATNRAEPGAPIAQQIDWTVVASGEYRVRVWNASGDDLAYLLDVAELSVAPSLALVGLEDLLKPHTESISSLRLKWNQPLDLLTLAAADFRVDGTLAKQVTAISAQEIELQLPKLAPGRHDLQIAGGVIRSSLGQTFAGTSQLITVQTTPVGPLGAMLSQGKVQGELLAGGDEIILYRSESDQRTSFRITTGGQLSARIDIRSLDGPLIATANLPAGRTTTVNDVDLPAGTYRLILSSQANSTGDYEVDLLIAGLFEGETTAGENDTLAGAQPLTFPVSGGANGAARIALVGTGDSVDQPLSSSIRLTQPSFRNSVTFSFNNVQSAAAGAYLTIELVRPPLSGGQEITLRVGGVNYPNIPWTSLPNQVLQYKLWLTREAINAAIVNGNLTIVLSSTNYVIGPAGSEARISITIPTFGARRDLFAVPAFAGQVITMAGAGAEGDDHVELELLGPQGESLSKGAAGRPYDSVIDSFTIPADGRYYLSARGIGEYTLSIVRGGAVDFGDNGSANRPQTLNGTSVVWGAIDQQGVLVATGPGQAINASVIKPGTLTTLNPGNFYAAQGLAPGLTPGTAYIMAQDDRELNLDTGTFKLLRNRLSFRENLAADPVNRTLYGADRERLERMDIANGKTEQTSPAPGWVRSIAYGMGGIFGLGLDSDNRLFFYDIPTDTWRIVGTVSQRGDTLAFDELNQVLYSLSRFDHQLYRIDPITAASAAVADFELSHRAHALSVLPAWSEPGLAPYFLNETADTFSFQAESGASVKITTATPAGASRLLQTRLALLNAAGQTVATAESNAADGHNAELTFPVPATGTYRVVVSGLENSFGEYLLKVENASGGAIPLEVTGVSLADGSQLAQAPTEVTIDFSLPVLASSLQAADLLIDGIPARSVTLMDADTARFNLPPMLTGPHRLTIDAGALKSTGNQPVSALGSSFEVSDVAVHPLASLIRRRSGSVPLTEVTAAALSVAVDPGNQLSLVFTNNNSSPVTVRLLRANGQSAAERTLGPAAVAVVNVATGNDAQFRLELSRSQLGTGEVLVDAWLNAQVESEWKQGNANGSADSAELLTWIGGTGWRSAATVGRVGDTVQESADWFRVAVADSGRLSLGVTGTDPTMPLTVELLSANGQIVSTGQASAPYRSLITRSAPTAPGDYLVRVTGKGEYSLVIQQGGIWESELLPVELASESDGVRGYVDGSSLLALVTNSREPTTRMFTINPETGEMLPIDQLSALTNNSIGIAAGPGRDLFTDGENLRRGDWNNDLLWQTFGVSGYSTGLEYVPSRNLIYRSAEYLNALNPVDGSMSANLARPPVFIDGLAHDGNTLFGLSGQDTQLYAYDLTNNAWRSLGDTGLTWPDAALAFDPSARVLYAKRANDVRLYRIDPATAQLEVVSRLQTPFGGGLDVIANPPVISEPTVPGGDTVDVYRILARAGDRLVISTRTPGDLPGGAGNKLDPQLNLRSRSGQIVATGMEGLDSRNESIDWLVTDSGWYELLLGSEGRTSGAYELFVEGANGTPSIEVHPVQSGALVTSGSIQFTQVVPGTTQEARLDLVAGQTFSVAITSTPSASPFQLSVVAPGGQVVMQSDASAITPRAWNTLLAETTGQFTVRLTSLGGSPIDLNLDVVIDSAWELERIGIGSNDQRATAQSIEADWRPVGGDGGSLTTLWGNTAAGNSDWYHLHLQAGSQLSAGISGDGLSVESFSLVDASGNIVASAAGNTGSFTRLLDGIIAPTTGDYYLRIVGSGNYLLTAARDLLLGVGLTADAPLLDELNHAIGSTRVGGTWLYASKAGPSQLGVLNLATGATTPIGFASPVLVKNMSPSHLPGWLYAVTNSGVFLSQLDGTMMMPWNGPRVESVTYDAVANKIYASSKDASAVYELNTNGQVIRNLPGIEFVSSVVAGDGRLFAVSALDNLLRVYDPPSASWLTVNTGRTWGEARMTYDPIREKLIIQSFQSPVYEMDPTTGAIQDIGQLPEGVSAFTFVPGLVDPSGQGATVWRGERFSFEASSSQRLQLLLTELPGPPPAGPAPPPLLMQLTDANGRVIAEGSGAEARLELPEGSSGKFFVAVTGNGDRQVAYTLAIQDWQPPHPHVVGWERLGTDLDWDGVRVDFDRAVDVLPSALEIWSDAGDRIPVPSTLAVNGTQATWLFDAVNWPIGGYQIRLRAGEVTSAKFGALDGNADGIPGDPWRAAVVVGSPGDADLDGDIDSRDLLLLLSNWTGAIPPGTGTMTFQDGDTDQDGDVDSLDLLVLLGSFTGSQSAEPYVPPTGKSPPPLDDQAAATDRVFDPTEEHLKVLEERLPEPLELVLFA